MLQLEDALKKGQTALILGGALVHVSLKEEAIPGYVFQKSVLTKSSMFGVSLNKSKSSKLHVWIQKEAYALLLKSSAKYGFYVDAILKTLKLKQEDFLILNSFYSENEYTLSCFSFKKGALDSLEDFKINANSFEADAHIRIEKLKMEHSSSKFYWLGPVDCPKSQALEALPESLYLSVALSKAGVSSDKAALFLIPAVITLISLFAYGLAYYIPLTQYEEARDQVRAEMDSLKQMNGKKGINFDLSFAQSRLVLLENISRYLESKKSTAQNLDRTEILLNEVSKNKAIQIDSLSVLIPSVQGFSTAKSSTTRDPLEDPKDFELTFKISVLKNSPVLDQIKPVVTVWSQQTGYELSVSKIATDNSRKSKNAAPSDIGMTDAVVTLKGVLK